MDETRINGDFNDILVYYTNLFSIQRRREIDVFGFSIKYSGHSLITSADNKSDQYIDDFPERELGLDRVSTIYLFVKKDSDPEKVFSCSISFDGITFNGSDDSKLFKEFIEAMDSSTFRFF